MLFKKLATDWAGKLANSAGETDEYKIALLRYQFECILSMLLSFLVILGVAMILDITKTALILSLAVAVIKSFTGGLHLSTPLRCAIAGGIIVAAMSYLAIQLPIVNISLLGKVLLLFFVNLIVWIKAPIEATGKPLSNEQKVNLAWLSRLLVLIFTIICLFFPQAWGVNELFYALLFQAVNLLKVTSHGIDFVDKVFDRFKFKLVMLKYNKEEG